MSTKSLADIDTKQYLNLQSQTEEIIELHETSQNMSIIQKQNNLIIYHCIRKVESKNKLFMQIPTDIYNCVAMFCKNDPIFIPQPILSLKAVKHNSITIHIKNENGKNHITRHKIQYRNISDTNNDTHRTVYCTVNYTQNSLLFTPKHIENLGIVGEDYFRICIQQIQSGQRKMSFITSELQQKLLKKPEYNAKLAETLINAFDKNHTMMGLSPIMDDLESNGIVPKFYFNEIEDAIIAQRIAKQNIIHDLHMRLQNRPDFSNILAAHLLSKAMDSMNYDLETEYEIVPLESDTHYSINIQSINSHNIHSIGSDINDIVTTTPYNSRGLYYNQILGEL